MACEVASGEKIVCPYLSTFVYACLYFKETFMIPGGWLHVDV